MCVHTVILMLHHLAHCLMGMAYVDCMLKHVPTCCSAEGHKKYNRYKSIAGMSVKVSGCINIVKSDCHASASCWLLACVYKRSLTSMLPLTVLLQNYFIYACSKASTN